MTTKQMAIQPREMTSVFEDDRWKERYCFTVRHSQSIIDILRFAHRADAVKAHSALRKAGYKVMRNDNSLSIACPKCGAPKGTQCFSRRGHNSALVHTKNPHAERVKHNGGNHSVKEALP